MNDTEKPTSLASVYFLLQGIGTLITWNAVLNGLDYFINSFPQFNVVFLFPIMIFVGQAVTNVLMIQLSKRFSFTQRIIGPLCVLGILLVAVPVITRSVAGTDSGFWIIMGLLFILGVSGTIYQSSLSGLAGFFPGKYTSLYLSGTGFAGLVMNALRSIAILSFETDGKAPDASTQFNEIIFYFSVASLIMISCAVIHSIFVKTPYYKVNAVLCDGGKDLEVGLAVDQISEGGSIVASESESGIKTMISVFMDVKKFVLSLVFLYTVNFVFYPGVMLKGNVDIGPAWKLVSMTGTFNVFDIIGKSFGQHRQSYTPNSVIALNFARIIFFATFILPVVTDIPILNTAFFIYFNIAVFAFTNGFITTALFIMSPENVTGKKKEIAGFLSTVGLTTGIMLGTFLALPFANLGVH